jgi:micrococcal nuclease
MAQYTYRAYCTKVIDGDTIDCVIDLGFKIRIKERVRLKGIDAYESRTRDLEEKEKGLGAKARLENLFLEADDWFLLTTDKDRTGKFGRTLGTIEIIINNTPVNVNNLLVDEGHAVSTT